jgi:predicted metal-dependent peptidase
MFNLDKGLTLEDYYKKLLKIAENNSKDLKNKSDGNPLKGDSKDLKGNPILGDKICKDAEEYAESIGKESGNMFEKVEILPTNYKAKINALVGCQPSTTKIKRSYSRRSKRFVKSPGLKKELELGNCIFGLDTSGSMSQEELGKALDVAKKIRHKCSKLTMIQGDTEVKDISSVKKNVREMTIKGRGGTTLTPIVEKAKEFGYPKVPLIMFTDGDVWDYPPKEQLKNSVWVFTKGSNAITFSKSHPGVKYAVMM